jgi:hypothetical protein
MIVALRILNTRWLSFVDMCRQLKSRFKMIALMDAQCKVRMETALEGELTRHDEGNKESCIDSFVVSLHRCLQDTTTT